MVDYQYDELYHHGVKGMKWGVRRYQNKDGSLTDAGKKRYVKQLTKEYKNGYDSAQPFRTNSKFNETTEKLVRNHITKEDIRNVKSALKKWNDSVDESDKAEEELLKLATELGTKEYKKELKRNPDAYTSERMTDKLFEMCVYDYGWDAANKARPDLAKKTDASDKLWSDYKEECKKVSDKILGDYGKTKLYDCKYYSYSVRDAVGDMINSMDNRKEFDNMFD